MMKWVLPVLWEVKDSVNTKVQCIPVICSQVGLMYLASACSQTDLKKKQSIVIPVQVMKRVD